MLKGIGITVWYYSLNYVCICMCACIREGGFLQMYVHFLCVLDTVYRYCLSDPDKVSLTSILSVLHHSDYSGTGMN